MKIHEALAKVMADVQSVSKSERNTHQNFNFRGIDAVLNERGSRYGEFEGHALITQELKNVMRSTANWSELTFAQREALEMVAHKIGRILNGDPNYKDSWTDIIGYTRLVEQRLP